MLTKTARDAKEFRDAGLWLDKTLDQLLSETIARTPDKLAIVADRTDREQARRISYRELGHLVDRVAVSLCALGVRPGDVVTVQLPNWWEFIAISLATTKIGAVINPVMQILRERELLYILNFCATKAFIVPKLYRGFDYSAMASGMRGDLPHLKHLIVVDGDGDNCFERQLLSDRNTAVSAGEDASRRLSADDMAVLMFTSGTTGEPKGVMHSSNSVIAFLKTLAGGIGLDENDVVLVASPVAHLTGFATLAMLSIYLGGTMILQDVLGAATRSGPDGARRRHLHRRIDAVPDRHLRRGKGRRAAPGELACVHVLRRDHSLDAGRARGAGAWRPSVLGMGDDGGGSGDPHRTVPRGGEVTGV